MITVEGTDSLSLEADSNSSTQPEGGLVQQKLEDARDLFRALMELESNGAFNFNQPSETRRSAFDVQKKYQTARKILMENGVTQDDIEAGVRAEREQQQQMQALQLLNTKADALVTEQRRLLQETGGFPLGKREEQREKFKQALKIRKELQEIRNRGVTVDIPY